MTLKTCVFDEDGKLINIGEWDEKICPVQVGEDGEGNPIYEDQPTNPLPTGAYTEEREVVQNADGGWRLASEPEPVTDRKRIEDLENLVVQLSLEGGD